MLTGLLPFDECPTNEEECELDFEGKVWKNITEETRHFVQKLLKFDVRERMHLDTLRSFCGVFLEKR